jgi:hypothetical protein
VGFLLIVLILTGTIRRVLPISFALLLSPAPRFLAQLILESRDLALLPHSLPAELKDLIMGRVLAICSWIFVVAITFAATQAAAQAPVKNSANSYSLSRAGETPTQQQRREREATARRLVFGNAAARATRRDQRIATQRALGISPARPDFQRRNWIESNWWTIPRIIYVPFVEPLIELEVVPLRSASEVD